MKKNQKCEIRNVIVFIHDDRDTLREMEVLTSGELCLLYLLSSRSAHENSRCQSSGGSGISSSLLFTRTNILARSRNTGLQRHLQSSNASTNKPTASYAALRIIVNECNFLIRLTTDWQTYTLLRSSIPVRLNPDGAITIISGVVQFPNLSPGVVEHREEGVGLSPQRCQMLQEFSPLRAENHRNTLLTNEDKANVTSVSRTNLSSYCCTSFAALFFLLCTTIAPHTMMKMQIVAPEITPTRIATWLPVRPNM